MSDPTHIGNDPRLQSRRCPHCGTSLRAELPEGLCPVCLMQRGLGSEYGDPTGKKPFVPPTITELARLFPQLEIIEPIGKGGMGAIYKARQPTLDRVVALKILARPSRDLDFAGRFTQEARALARLNHPNIVAVYDFGQVENLNYFIMEFVDGPNLRQIQQAGRLSPVEALQIIPQICAALQFAHDEAIVHRDIKPENVLLDKKGRVKIADFGLAKILGQEPDNFRLTGARDIVGTPHYMAPEQVEKPLEVDHRADIYSLGVVFYEMLTGELPLGRFQPPSARVQMDVRLDEVVLRTLEKEPARRYQHVSEVKTRVETIAAGKPVSNGFAPETGPPPRPARNVPVVRLFGILGLVVLGFAAVMLIKRMSSESPRAGLIAEWSAEGNATDTAGANNGVVEEGVTFTKGVKGEAFQFDGVRGGIVVPASASLNVGTNDGFTVEAWVKPYDVASGRPIVEWNKKTGPEPFGAHFWICLGVATPGLIGANLVDTNGDWHGIQAAAGSIIANIFQHVALTYDKSSGLARLFVNGILLNEANIGKFTPQTSYDFYIGSRPNGIAGQGDFFGVIDEIRLYNRALSPVEIKNISARRKLRAGGEK